MSSLSATQADGYFIPSSYFESGVYKSKSISKHAGSKGHNLYLTNSIVRFELPYDGICLNKVCGAHVGRGTRFNAKKSQTGSYFTTKIWQFDMKCRICSNQGFVIRTDPKRHGFQYVSGIKKKELDFVSTEMNNLGNLHSNVKSNGKQTLKNISSDSQNKCIKSEYHHIESPLMKLERRVIGKRIAITERDKLICLLQRNSYAMSDDAKSNADVRAIYRKRRKLQYQKIVQASRLGLGNGIEMGDITIFDALMTKKIFQDKTKMNQRKNNLFQRLCDSSIFGSVDNMKKSKQYEGSRDFNRNI